MTDKLKNKQTMATGVTTANFKPAQALTLHNELVSVIVSDTQETVVQYGNGAQRTFRTNDLASYLDLGVFPTSTRFSRPVEGGMEQAYVEHNLPDRYIMEVIGADGLEPADSTPMTYAELMTWHMTGPKPPAERTLPGKLYLPKVQPVVEAADEPDVQPFETELKDEVARLQEELEQMEIRAQTTINSLTKQLKEAKEALLQQDGIHNTRLLAAAGEVETLQRKVEALTNPPPTCKEVCTLIQKLANPEDRQKSDVELAEKLGAGWTPLNITVTDVHSEIFSYYTRIVTLVRDLPAAPAPTSLTTETVVSLPAVRPSVQKPPMPTNQTIVPVSTGEPVVNHNRWLTNNVAKAGDTKRIPTLASLQERRVRDAAEIDAILERGANAQEVLRREFANKPNPFPVTGVQPS